MHSGVDFFAVWLNLVCGEEEAISAFVTKLEGVREWSVISSSEHGVVSPVVGTTSCCVEEVSSLSGLVALSVHGSDSSGHFLTNRV